MSSDRIAHFTRSLRDRTELLRLGPAPALVALPEEGARPAPCVVWLHGRTVSKEIDSARYTRLVRGGYAVCAFDLPGHGEREDAALQAPDALSRLLRETLAELDLVVEALLAHPRLGPRIDRERLALGGMSAGGMVTLRRLCDPHPYRCAVIESSCGDFRAAAASPQDRWSVAHLEGLDPARHLETWRPIPLLALHSERDEVCPLVGVTAFLDALRPRYAAAGAEQVPLVLHTWPETGAPSEHAGFGRKSGEARRLLLEFFDAHLAPDPEGSTP